MKLYKIFNKPPFILRSSFWISRKSKRVKSSSTSRSAVIIPFLLIQYGSLKDKIKGFPIVGKALATSIKEMYKSVSQLNKNPKKYKKLIDSNTLIDFEKYAKQLGISQIGYTNVNPDFIFKGFEILYDKAMVISMEMNREDMIHNPTDASTKEIWRTYSQLGIIVNKLAEFIREKGYRCHPSPAVGGDVMIVPIAQDSGIGAVGKNGLLITPEFGPSQRLAAIFLDIDNLPISKKNEHLWIREFCNSCNNCVHKCPGKAIYKETKILADGYPNFIERERCAPSFSKNCSQCISSCPFIHGNYDKIKETFEHHKRAGTSINIQEHIISNNKETVYN